MKLNLTFEKYIEQEQKKMKGNDRTHAIKSKCSSANADGSNSMQEEHKHRF